MSQSEFDSALPNGIGLAPYLRMKQEGMTENESRIVEWLLKPGNLSCAPAIKDVAEALAVSEAMIVKVSKLLGFSGFRNLRSALEDYFSQSEQVLPSELAFDEAPQDVVNKVFNITLRTIMEGQSIVNVDEIHRAARFSIRPDSGICTVPEDQMLSVLMYSTSSCALAYAVRPILMLTS